MARHTAQIQNIQTYSTEYNEDKRDIANSKYINMINIIKMAGPCITIIEKNAHEAML